MNEWFTVGLSHVTTELALEQETGRRSVASLSQTKPLLSVPCRLGSRDRAFGSALYGASLEDLGSSRDRASSLGAREPPIHSRQEGVCAKVARSKVGVAEQRCFAPSSARWRCLERPAHSTQPAATNDNIIRRRL